MEELRKLQLTQLEILKTVDRLCRENGICYSLSYGTMLGAVRHSGFIPWDDDLDICMPRDDYDRFTQIWLQNPPAGYYLQNKEITPGYAQSFSKIRKEHTTFLQDEEEIGKYNPGIFIDIFPMDRIPNGMLKALRFKASAFLYNLMTREYPPRRNGRIIQAGSQILLALIPTKRRPAIRRRLLRQLTRYNGDPQCCVIGTQTFYSLKRQYPPSLLEAFSEIRFEDDTFMCFKEWETYLSTVYGDYMKLPPESKRAWRHHPILLDFEHDYEEIAQGKK